MSIKHPAVAAFYESTANPKPATDVRNSIADFHTTSPSLARALAVGLLSRLSPDKASVNIWDPAAGMGFTGAALAHALTSTGTQVRYRGQDINGVAVAESRRLIGDLADAEITHANTLTHDAFEDFAADLVIVDAPWGMDWRGSREAVVARHAAGAFKFGLPATRNATWLFISLALEKLLPEPQGGGRVAALVNPSVLWEGGRSGMVRKKIVDAGLLESVTRLPDGLAPNTSIPLYLVTFTNRSSQAWHGRAMIADLQDRFTTDHGRRSMPVSALDELESGLRTGRPGPQNRLVDTRQFTTRTATLTRTSTDGSRLSWGVTTYNDERIDEAFLQHRYGRDSEVSLEGEVTEGMNLDPGAILVDNSREIWKDLDTKGWPSRRLSSVLRNVPEAFNGDVDDGPDDRIFIPTTREGEAQSGRPDAGSTGRVLTFQLDGGEVDPGFLVAWLNSDTGVSSRRRAIDSSISGTTVRALRSDANSLMRWADELIIPVPDRDTQEALAAADDQLASFQADLRSQRQLVWSDPDSAGQIVSSISPAFDRSLTLWLDTLPYPIASALWTAETAASPSAQQKAYIHAWEAIVAFHATVLLSASRSDPSNSSEIEGTIRQTLRQHNLGIERASIGTWIIIAEKTAKNLRNSLEQGDADDIARVRRAFAGLRLTGIERLISKDIVNKFREVNSKRNRWLGHTGYTSDQDLSAQVAALVADLRDLRDLLGSVWTQLLLVRAGAARRSREGFVQSAQVAVGTRSPFATMNFRVGDMMMDGELHLVLDGSQSPLRLDHFVQLRAAPRDARYTTYFYNSTDGENVRMVSYQYGSDEVQDHIETFRDAFGALAAGDQALS